MKNLEQEAEEYIKQDDEHCGAKFSFNEPYVYSRAGAKQAFINGATSDYVKKQTILGQIEVLKKLENEYPSNLSIRIAVKEEIQELKAKLK